MCVCVCHRFEAQLNELQASIQLCDSSIKVTSLFPSSMCFPCPSSLERDYVCRSFLPQTILFHQSSIRLLFVWCDERCDDVMVFDGVMCLQAIERAAGFNKGSILFRLLLPLLSSLPTSPFFRIPRLPFLPHFSVPPPAHITPPFIPSSSHHTKRRRIDD